MTLRALTLTAAAAALSLAAPAAAQTATPNTAAPTPAGAEAASPPPRRAEPPIFFGDDAEGFTAEEFSWMNPESDRWPNDLDPRDNEYLPKPRPTVTFKLDLGL